MSQFKREPRYIVFKIKDLDNYGDCVTREALRCIGEQIADGRRRDGKPPFNALVVEQDWPEFEPTWAAIEARCNGERPGPRGLEQGPDAESYLLDLHRQLREARAAIPKPCTWRQDDDGLWQTDCKNTFVFNDDGPEANGFRVCPYCGGQLVTSPI